MLQILLAAIFQAVAYSTIQQQIQMWNLPSYMNTYVNEFLDLLTIIDFPSKIKFGQMLDHLNTIKPDEKDIGNESSEDDPYSDEDDD